MLIFFVIRVELLRADLVAQGQVVLGLRVVLRCGLFEIIDSLLKIDLMVKSNRSEGVESVRAPLLSFSAPGSFQIVFTSFFKALFRQFVNLAGLRILDTALFVDLS